MDNARISGIQVRKVGDVSSDTDGIPDWWRLGYFGHALGQAGDNSRGADDADDDGASNLEEFGAGTDPLNSASVFRIMDLTLTNDVDVAVTCLTVSNRAYQLQRRESFELASTWTSVGPIKTTTNSGVTLFDFGGGTNAAGYYRVRAQ